MMIRNGRIIGTSLSNSDHGVLSSFININDGHGSIGFGGYMLYNPENPKDKSFAGHFIFRVLEIAGVTDWKNLDGCFVRIRIGDDGRVDAIGHIINNDWFDIKKEYEENVLKV